ncbi:hypothetical protein AB5N19_09537 [Seiridium cardinale]
MAIQAQKAIALHGSLWLTMMQLSAEGLTGLWVPSYNLADVPYAIRVADLNSSAMSPAFRFQDRGLPGSLDWMSWDDEDDEDNDGDAEPKLNAEIFIPMPVRPNTCRLD